MARAGSFSLQSTKRQQTLAPAPSSLPPAQAQAAPCPERKCSPALAYSVGAGLEHEFLTPPATPKLAPRQLRPGAQGVMPQSSGIVPMSPASTPSHASSPSTLGVQPLCRSRLGQLLRSQELVDCLEASGRVGQPVLASLVALAEQAVHMGIDYGALGHNWNHPKSRTQYRQGQHPSITCAASRARAEASRQQLVEAIVAILHGARDAEAIVVDLFVKEIGLHPKSTAARSASFAGVAAALRAELLLPLRALNEGQKCMHFTFRKEAVPPGAVSQTVDDLIAATLSRPGGFSDWRYSHPVGAEQLRGLDALQAAVWRQPTSVDHTGGIRSHECEDGELGLFWATKIGGPSHGFDFEGQCNLALLANARNKVILISDPAWPAHPVGRAHFRCLWAVQNGTKVEPRLWLEAVNCDFDAKAAGVIDYSRLVRAVLWHAMAKADAMRVSLSVDPSLANALTVTSAGEGTVRQHCEIMLLRPSNGVCEASDFLSKRHDWVQLQEELTAPIPRVLYTPAAMGSNSVYPCMPQYGRL